MFVRDRHVLIEVIDVELAERILHKLLCYERMLGKLLDWNTSIFVHLEALDHEQACLNARWLLKADLVATIVDLRNEILHLKTVERGDTDKHLVEHHTQRPGIDLCCVSTLLQQLWT